MIFTYGDLKIKSDPKMNSTLCDYLESMDKAKNSNIIGLNKYEFYNEQAIDVQSTANISGAFSTFYGSQRELFVTSKQLLNSIPKVKNIKIEGTCPDSITFPNGDNINYEEDIVKKFNAGSHMAYNPITFENKSNPNEVNFVGVFDLLGGLLEVFAVKEDSSKFEQIKKPLIYNYLLLVLSYIMH